MLGHTNTLYYTGRNAFDVILGNHPFDAENTNRTLLLCFVAAGLSLDTFSTPHGPPNPANFIKWNCMLLILGQSVEEKNKQVVNC